MNKKITVNYIFVLLYQTLLIITPIFTMPYVIRVLQPENIGIEAYVGSVVQLFIAFASLGIGDYGRKEIAAVIDKRNLKTEFFSLYTIQFVFSTLVLVVYLVFAFLSTSYTQLFLINSLTILAYVLDVTWFFTGQENMKNIMIRNMVVRIVSIIGIFMLVKEPDDLSIYILINALSLLLGQLVTWIPLLKQLRGFSISFQLVKKHIFPILIFAVVPILTLIPTALNKVILGNVAAEVDVGFYNQSFKLITLFVVFVTALSTVMSPRMVKQYNSRSRESFESSFYFSVQYVSFSTLPIVTGLIAIAPSFIPWFLGQDFQASVINLQILAPSLFFSGLAGVFGIQVLITSGKNKAYTSSVLIASVCSFITNLILIPHLKSIGTSIAYLIFTMVLCILQAYFARSFFDVKQTIKKMRPYVLASGVAFLGEIAISYFRIGLMYTMVLQVVVGIVVYGAFLILKKDSFVEKIKQIIVARQGMRRYKRKES
ncbi:MULTISPECIES: polysaccharide biosynthesis C-terminal domain-containing protein [Listeria]|uniref:oligosaccharide flippase family protein n=1 Tax=Listeria TaxID=1637 RepID=UPI000B590B1B|nr:MULTISPECIES: polysaccharide biosynthesis C-terminal domain-containing protein [Listeria]